MAARGILLAPSQFEALFLCAAHSDEDNEYFLVCADEVAGSEGF